MEKTELYTTKLQQLTQSWVPLPDKPEETPERTLRALWHSASGKPVSLVEAQTLPLPTLDDAGQQRLAAFVEQRIAGMPLSYLTGRQIFLGMEILTSPGAMIPRLETELLGHEAINTANALAAERGEIRGVDICTGSGNLALAIAHYEKKARMTGIDITAEAVELAGQNAAHQGLSDRVDFLCGDLFAPIESAEFWNLLDLVVCNPPYISSAQVDRLPEEIQRFEPREAFDGGPFGVKVLQRLINEAPRFLKPASYLCFEVGLGQGPVLEKILRKNGSYDQIDTLRDGQGDIRAFKARTQA